MKVIKCIFLILLPILLSYVIINPDYPWVMTCYAVFLVAAEYGYYLAIKRYGMKQGLLRIGIAAFIIASLSAAAIFFPEYVPFRIY